MSRWGERLKKVEHLAQSFELNPLTTRYKPRLWPCQPSSVWKLFPRQSLAFSFTQSCKETVHVFALEKEKISVGHRIYLVTSYSELWHYYRTYPQSLMHCYEVIPEGAVCKLYFDLEFHKPSNKSSNGPAMVSMLIQFVCEKLLEFYQVQCSAKDVLNLDSSTEEKFSRHLIFILQNEAFKDNIHVGRFIHAILQPILNPDRSRIGEDCRTHSIPEGNGPGSNTAVERENPLVKRRKHADLHFLQVKNKDGQDCLFVDLSVYTKNRNFRLYKSSKAGKNSAFTVAEDNQFIPKPEKGISSEQSVFLASLVRNVSFNGQRILSWGFPESNGLKTVLPHCQQGPSSNTDTLSGYLSSPHKEVDEFVVTLVRRDGIQGSIRRWNYFAEEQLLVYDIAKYRWCENVGRFHKSNNIMIVVDLKEEVWYQKCHDPECKNFRASSYPIPHEICLSYIMTLDEEDQAYLMDDAGNIEPTQITEVTRQSALSAGALQEEYPDIWGNQQEEKDFLQCLDNFEQNGEEIPDQLLLSSLAGFDSQ